MDLMDTLRTVQPRRKGRFVLLLFTITILTMIVTRIDSVYNVLKGVISPDIKATYWVTPKSLKSDYNQQPNVPVESDLDDWTFTKRVKCPEFSIETKSNHRREKLLLECSSGYFRALSYTTTDDPNDVDGILPSYKEKCLVSAIDKHCYDGRVVPNVMHFVWYSKRELNFFHFLSFMSSVRFVNPCLILIHGDSVPYGQYWNYFIQQYPRVILVKRTKPDSIGGNILAMEEHASDIMRIEALMAYGGIYIDTDEVLLKPVDDLRKYNHTQGVEFEIPSRMGSQFIAARKNSTFLHLWYKSYFTDYRKTWAYNALLVPLFIAEEHPELIHREDYQFTRPNVFRLRQMYDGLYNWSENYGMHLLIRFWKREMPTVESIRQLNTTIGSISRHILLGNKEICL